MALPNSETITLRALGPLPDLDSVVFVRKLNRAFVTGRGPLGPPSPWPARRFLRVGMWLMLAAGIVISLIVGAAEYFERQHWQELQTTLRTVDAEVIGCDAATIIVPQFRYTAEGKVYQHYARETRGDICDKKPWQVTFVTGAPDSWAIAPASPLPPFEDEIGEYWIISGPFLLALAAVYCIFLWFADRRAGREARLIKEGGLIGAELLSAKYYPGNPRGGIPSVRVKFRMTLPNGAPVDGKQSFTMFDLDRHALPPAGSKLLILRVDDTLQQPL
jgi:hypothetical protein